MADFSFHNPVRVLYGRGRATELPDLVTPPALVVAGEHTLRRAGLEDVLRRDDDLHLFTEVEPNPKPATIEAGVARADAVGARTVVGVGGGSPQDAAKCIAVMAGNATTVADFQARLAQGEVMPRRVELVQVPTTAGTGSEVTRWASVWDGEGRKSSLDHPEGYADTALVDPALTDTMGPRLTAATGLDAMAHAMESLWGVRANPVSDAYAMRALQLVVRHLASAVTAPEEAHRDAMAQAALLAGLALSNCRSAAAHALSYGLTGRFGMEHGLAVGLLCHALLPWNADHAPARVQLIVEAMDAGTADGVGAYIAGIFRAAGLEPSLRQFGVAEGDLAFLVERAAGADRLANNPGKLGRDDLRAILERVA